MILYFVGALNGDYSPVMGKLDPRPDWILCVGSFGVWPDPQNVDRATKRHGVGQFPDMYVRQVAFPYPTIFVEGTNDDHKWLYMRELKKRSEVLPNVSHLQNGYTTTIGDIEHQLTVLGIGKPYSENYHKPGTSWERCYYTKAEIATACTAGPVDIFLAHEGLHGEIYGKYKCQAEGMQKVIYATRPKLFIHGHFNAFREYQFLDTKCYSLAAKQLLRVEYDGTLFNCSIVH